MKLLFSSQRSSTKACCYSSPPTAALGFKFLLGLQRDEHISDFNFIKNFTCTYVVSWIFMVLILMWMSYSIQWSWRRECINNVKEMDGAKLLLLCRPRALLYNSNKDKWKSNKSIRRPFILCTLDILPIGPNFKEACNSSKTNFLLAPHCSGQSSPAACRSTCLFSAHTIEFCKICVCVCVSAIEWKCKT